MVSRRRLPLKLPAPTPPELGQDIMTSAIAKMTPAQRAIYEANAPKATQTPRSVRKLSVQTVPPSARRLRVAKHPTMRAERDEALVSRRNAQIEAIKKAYGGTVPNTAPPAR